MKRNINDYSTLNIAKLNARGTYKLPPTYRLGDPGNGCAGDPPGYPSYYTRYVYTRHGNDARNAPQYVISVGDKLLIAIPKNTPYEKWEDLLRSLWKPLPIDHPRTVAWMQETYSHHRNCYRDVNQVFRSSEYGKPATVIYPLTELWRVHYCFREFKDDERFNDQWREKEKAAIAEHNAQLMERYLQVITPENHSAVSIIRKFYPEHQPNQAWIDNPPASPGEWWSTMSEQPSPEECPGVYGYKHPVNGSWCQWCGWRESLAVA